MPCRSRLLRDACSSSLVDEGVEFALWVDVPTSKALPELVDNVVRAVNAQQEDPAQHVDCAATDCDLYDWEFRTLPADTDVGQVPEPGVVVAVRSGRETDFGGSVTGLMVGVRAALTSDETYGPRLRRFISGPDAFREAMPLIRYDAFVSYSSRDGVFATALVRQLGRRGLGCFLAQTSLSAGRLWADELRDALVSSRAGVILLTPQSVGSTWVQAEVGAIWALGRPVVPVLVGVSRDEVTAWLDVDMDRAITTDDTTEPGPPVTDVVAERLARTLQDLRTSGAA